MGYQWIGDIRTTVVAFAVVVVVDDVVVVVVETSIGGLRVVEDS